MEYCSPPVATKTPAANNTAPLGKKKQKNRPVVLYTNRKTINNPPYLISDSGSKIVKILFSIYGIPVGSIAEFKK
ncbi:MAG TPA: hypothetical protein VJU78_11445 [Chitinophagaceae bacterium]|nr:hypothetical protein [Chitinophagaceae bacterium]